MIAKDKRLEDFFPMLSHVQVWAVLDKGWQKRIDPTEAENVRCPMCNGADGYTCLIDPKRSGEQYQWGCLTDDCIRRNKVSRRVKNLEV